MVLFSVEKISSALTDYRLTHPTASKPTQVDTATNAKFLSVSNILSFSKSLNSSASVAPIESRNGTPGFSLSGKSHNGP